MARGKNHVQTNKKYSSYNEYVTKEWESFKSNTKRQDALIKATANIEVQTVLDIGCGGGQEMLPFVVRGANAVGMDVMPEVGQVGREMFEAEGFGEKVGFLRASGNELPFVTETFDVLICRGALMFMDIEVALPEMARVLRPGGIFFLMYQAPAYYRWKFSEGLKTGNILSSIHATRCLMTGCFYHVTGHQPFNKLTAAGETFVTKKILQREIDSLGLKIIGEMPDTNSQTPSLILSKIKSK